MESTDLKNDSPDDAQLDAWLHNNAAAAPLRDDGFSHRVLAALPAAAAQSAGRRRLFCLIGALAGTTVALLAGGDWSGAPDNLAAAAPPLVYALSQVNHPAALCALAIASASVLYALRRSLGSLAGN